MKYYGLIVLTVTLLNVAGCSFSDSEAPYERIDVVPWAYSDKKYEILGEVTLTTPDPHPWWPIGYLPCNSETIKPVAYKIYGRRVDAVIYFDQRKVGSTWQCGGTAIHFVTAP